MKRTPLLPSQWGVARRKKGKAEKHENTRTKASLMAECRVLWSRIVRERCNHLCEWCSVPAVDAHHMEGKTENSLRFETRNGVGLCRKCNDYFEFVDRDPGQMKFRAARPQDWAYIQELKRIRIPLGIHDLEDILAGLKEKC